MNGLYFLLPFILVASIGIFNEAIAVDSIRGEDYIKTVNPDGSITQTIGLPPYIQTENGYQPFVFTEDSVFLTVETGHGSVRLNKLTCTFGIYEDGYIESPIFDDEGNVIGTTTKDPDFNSNVNAWKKNNIGPTFQNLAVLNGGTCTTSWNGSDLVATQTEVGIAEKTVTFTLQDFNWKTTYEITNLDSQANVYAFKELLDVEGNEIVINGDSKPFTTYSGQTFDKQFLDDNNGQSFEFGNWYYDFDVGYEFVNGIKVLDNGVELEFRSGTINPLETWIVDPTFGEHFDSDDGMVIDGGSNNTCDGNSLSRDTTSAVFQPLVQGGGSDDCKRGYMIWDVSSFPTNADVTNLVLTYDVTAINAPRTCDWVPLTTHPETGAIATVWGEFDSATDYVTGDSTCQTISNGKTIDLGTTADSDFESAIGGEFYLGVMENDESYDSGTRHSSDIASIRSGTNNGPTLTVTYNIPPDPPTEFFGNAYDWYGLDMTWGAGELNGDTHNDYTIQWYNSTSAAWEDHTTQTGTWLLENSPPDEATSKYRIRDNGVLGFGCYQTLMNGTLSSNLVGHAPLCYTTNDSSGNDDDYVISGNELYRIDSSEVGFDFDTNSFMESTTESLYDRTHLQPFSITGWAYADTDGVFFLVGKSNGHATANDGFRLIRASGNDSWQFELSDGTTEYVVSGGANSFPIGEWRHFTVTYDGSGNKNGISIYTNDGNPAIGGDQTGITDISNNLNYTIGAEADGGAMMDGIMRDVRFWNVTLTQHQIDQLYNEYIDTKWKPFAINDLTASVVDLDTVRLDFSDPTEWRSTSCYDINYTTPLGSPTTVAESCTAVAGAYLIDGLNTFDNAYSFRMGVVNPHGTNATGNIANVTAFDPFVIGSISTPVGDNPNILPITFVEYQDNSTQTTLQVIFDSSYDLSCNWDYVYGRTNQTYTGLAETTISGTQVYHNFTVTNPENEIINIYCWDANDNSTNGRYLIDQSSIPFFNQIDDFSTGVFGPSGMFGIFDFATLIIVIVSMIGFNRYNPALGVITMVAFLGVMTYYEVIAWQSSLIGVSALVLMLAIMQVRKP